MVLSGGRAAAQRAGGVSAIGYNSERLSGRRRNEPAETAARRELREETGCEIAALASVGEIEEELSNAPHRAHLFAGVVDAVPKVDGREVVEARFFPVHSLPEPLSPRTRTRLALWQDWRSRASQR